MVNAIELESSSERGKNAIPIILLHGWGKSHKELMPMAELLREVAPVYVLDLPGFGQSPVPNETWGVKDYAECVHAYCVEKGLSKIILFGHSFGGRITVVFSQMYPSMVQKLCLMGAAGLSRKRTLKENVRIKWIKTLSSIARILETYFGFSTLRNWFREKYGSPDYKNAGPMRNILVKTINEDLTEFAKQITQPALLLWGELDTETPVDVGEKYATLIKNSTLIVLPGKGHEAYLGTGYNICAHYIKQFLAA